MIATTPLIKNLEKQRPGDAGVGKKKGNNIGS